jgi:predicted esterase
MEITVNSQTNIHIQGELTDNTKQVWIVCHGYGQLVKFFSQWLTPILDEETCIICPEGLHKFYLQGFGGRVGAHWMTKDKREDDIERNHQYLNKIYAFVKENAPQAKLNCIGFSQGAQTMSRWVLSEDIPYDVLCLWGGRQAEDISLEEYKTKTSRNPIYIRMGDDDEFYGEEKVENWLDSWRKENVPFQFTWYKGKHKIEKQAILDFRNSISTNKK